MRRECTTCITNIFSTSKFVVPARVKTDKLRKTVALKGPKACSNAVAQIVDGARFQGVEGLPGSRDDKEKPSPLAVAGWP